MPLNKENEKKHKILELNKITTLIQQLIECMYM